MEETQYLVIGGGLVGGSAVSAIRKRDSSGRIVLVTSEPHTPYDRVPLSKGYLMNKVAREKLFLQKTDYYEKHRIEIIQEQEVAKLDLANRTAFLHDGLEISFGRLLLATGGRPKKPPIPGSELEGVYYLRTLEDCDRIKDVITRSRNAAVVGGGFIGCELAAAFSSQGLSTTILEMGPYLLNMAMDEETGRWVGDYFSNKGVRVLTDSIASEFVGKNGRVVEVKTKEGKTIPCDFVVVGVGISPNTGLAQETGLKVDNGIVVNEFLETERKDVYAGGDVARFYSPLLERHMRVEHYDVAVKHGLIAGANMAGDRKPFAELPYFFSYQFELKINAYGDLSGRREVVRRGSLSSEQGFFQFYLENGKLVAVLSVNRKWDEIKIAKNLVLSRKVFSDPQVLSDDSKELQSLS